MIIHMTASVFLIRCREHPLRLGLVRHPRLAWTVPGGHVEHEMPSDAAVRETIEETGIVPRLLPPPGQQPSILHPHTHVVRPWWIARMPAAADAHAPCDHVHEDHQYLAVADHRHRAGVAEHPFRWATADELPDEDMPPGTLTTARHLLALLHTRPNLLADAYTGPPSGGGA